MPVFAYTHRVDCDGICSAAILKRYIRKEGLKGTIDFINYEPQSEAREIFGKIGELGGGSAVIIADFGYDDILSDLAERSFKKLKDRGGRIVWLDHHKWDEGGLKRLSQFAEIKLARSDEFCGAELVYREYMKDDGVSEALAKLGRDADIDAWRTNPPKPAYALTKPISNLITYYNYLGDGDHEKQWALLSELVDKLADATASQILSNGFDKPLWDEKLESDYRKYIILELYKLEECLSDAEVFSSGGYRCAVSLADDVISTTIAGNSLISRYNADLSLVFYRNGKLGVRRNNSRLDIKCNEIAKLFGGGGHEYAAGGHLNLEIKNAADKSRAKSEIKRILSSLKV